MCGFLGTVGQAFFPEFVFYSIMKGQNDVDDLDKEKRVSKLVVNRRLKYFEQHLENSDYLSEIEMQRRDPSGWQYYVGQYNGNEPPIDTTCEAGYGLGSKIRFGFSSLSFLF